MLSGNFPFEIRYAILYANVLDFPEPAHAKHKILLDSSITASYCSPVKLERNISSLVIIPFLLLKFMMVSVSKNF